MTKSKHPVIELSDISKTFVIREQRSQTIRDFILNILLRKHNSSKTINALTNINLSIYNSEVLGIIGRNGSGKSTLINIIMESIVSDKGGVVKTKGKIIRLALGMGVDPNLSARDNIYVNGSVLGLTFDKIGNIFDDIISFSDLENFVDTPVKFYSKGMKQRLLFSIAIYAEADIFLLDEFFGGTGDKEFREKSDLAFQEKIIQGKTIVIVSHSMNIIKKYCKKVIWIEDGKIKTTGTPSEVIEQYRQNTKRKKS